MSQIMGLSKEADPSLDSLLLEVTRLAASEWGQFVSSVRARVYAIKALQKIVGAVDFKARENEGQIQKLFEKSPWLIDPRYSKIMSADQKKSSLFQRLEKELGISQTPMAVGTEVDERPDLVFLLGNESLRQVIVVELKSANTPLESKHLDQLMAYMGDAEEWLDAVGQSMKVEGQLIGSLNTGSKAKGVRALVRRIDRAGMESDWRVRDYVEVLNDTLDVHQDILMIADKEGV